MKEAKKTEEASAARARAIRQAWQERNRVCSQARQTLLQLEGWMSEHAKQLDQKRLMCARFSASVARVVQNGGTMFMKSDATVLAQQLIAGKHLAEIIMGEQEALKAFYDSLRFNEGGVGNVGGEGDLAIFKQWDFERAAVAILKAAIKLQKEQVLVQTRSSMARFSKAVAEIRSATVRDFLAVLAELKAAAAPDQMLAEGLEPDEIACLRPRPFPLQILSAEAMNFLFDAVSENMISPAELGSLQLETVKTAETAEPEAKRWIQEGQP